MLFVTPTYIFSQEITKENDFTVHYYPSKIELEFDKTNIPSYIKVINLITNNEKMVVKKTDYPLILSLDEVHPSDLYKIEYILNNNKSSTLLTTYIAAKSASTGTITVYFNHPVDISFAQTQQAINLSNTIVNMLITYINNCVATMDIAIYDSYSPSSTTGIAGAINAAYARGVQVRVIYNGSTSNTMIALLNSAIPRLTSPTSSSYGIMHNKFVIFDANNTDANLPYVWTGSTNWTSAQINGPDKNNVIILQDQSLALAYKIEFEEMWGSSTLTPNSTNSKFGPYKTDNTPHNFIIGGKTVQNYFSPSDGTTAKIISAINSANTDIEVAVMDLTRTDCSSAIISKYNGGVNSNVLVDINNPTGNQLVTLQSALPANHAKVYNGTGIMHHKFMVVDNYNSASDPLVLVGSHNWSTSAETKNDENTLIVHDANITNQYYQAFAYLFQLAGGIITPSLSTTTSTYHDGLLKIYPNPNHGLLYLFANQTIDHLEVIMYNILGEKIITTRYDSFAQNTIDISNQPRGIYFIEANIAGSVQHFKIIKD